MVWPTPFSSAALQPSAPAAPAAPGAASQHALLGEIAFDLITYFEGIECKFGADYAEHSRIQGKPRLQWTGDKLEEIDWRLVFHAGFCEPEHELHKLRQAVAAHKALPLVFSNGHYKGYFLPTEASVTTQQTHSDGTAVWIEVRLSLREYPQPAPAPEATPRQPGLAVSGTQPASLPRLPAQKLRKMPPARLPQQKVVRNVCGAPALSTTLPSGPGSKALLAALPDTAAQQLLKSLPGALAQVVVSGLNRGATQSLLNSLAPALARAALSSIGGSRNGVLDGLSAAAAQSLLRDIATDAARNVLRDLSTSAANRLVAHALKKMGG